MKSDALKGFFAAMGEHHVAMAKAHSKMATHCDEGAAAQEFHKSAASAHTTAAETCIECCKEGKAMLANRDDDRIMPVQVHGVLPDNPDAMARLIARPGQPLVLPEDGDPTAALDRAMGRN